MKCLNCGAEILTNTCVLCGTHLTPEQETYIENQVNDYIELQGNSIHVIENIYIAK